MGLDTVELVLRLEADFGIEIPEAEFGPEMTLGRLHAVVLRRMVFTGRTPDADTVWLRQCELVREQLPSGFRGELVPGTRLATLFPNG